MASNFVPCRGYLPNESGMAVGHPAKNKEGPDDPVTGQQLQAAVRREFDSRRKLLPTARLPRNRKLGRMEVVLHIDGEGVEHVRNFARH